MDLNMFLFVFTGALSFFMGVYGDYDCLCNYNVEKTVFSKPESNSIVIGYMYEFDCKPIYKNLPANSVFQSIQFEKQVGYVESDSNLSIQSCQGTVPKEDGITTTSPSTLSSHLTTTQISVTAPSKSASPTVVTSSSNNSMSATVMVLLPNGTYVQTNEHSTPNPSNIVTTTTPTTTTSTTTTPTTTTSSTTTPTATTFTTTTPTTTTTTSTTTKPTTTTSTTTTPTTTTSTTTKPTTTTSTTTTQTTTTSTTTTTTTTVPPPSCPNGWVMYRESCYKFRTQHRMEWQQANEDCRSSSSHLAIIETEDENNFIKHQLNNRINTNHDHDADTAAWVGGSDNDNEGIWEWFNGLTNTRSQMTYTHWKPGQPDAGEHDHDEDCMCMVGNKGFAWEDYSCREDMYFVCEKSALHTPSSPTTHNSGNTGPHTSSNCKPGWTFHDGSCYFFHTDSRWEWPHADAYCTKHHAHLAIIDTAAENSFLAQVLIQRIDADRHDNSDTGTWLSGTDSVHESHWMWKDGSQYKPVQYSNWSPGEPDHGDDEHEEDCMAMIGNKHFHWHDYPCNENMFFVCEQSASASFGSPVIIG